MILFSKKIFQQAKTKSQIMIAGARLRWSGETAQVGQLGTWQPRIKFQSSKRFFVANFKACAKNVKILAEESLTSFAKKMFSCEKKFNRCTGHQIFLQEWKIENKQKKSFYSFLFLVGETKLKTRKERCEVAKTIGLWRSVNAQPAERKPPKK